MDQRKIPYKLKHGAPMNKGMLGMLTFHKDGVIFLQRALHVLHLQRLQY